MMVVNDSLHMLLPAVLLSALIAAGVLWGVLRMSPSTSPSKAPEEGRASSLRCVFLIKDGLVTDQSGSSGATNVLRSWNDLHSWLGGRFGDIPKDLTDGLGDESQVFHPIASDDTALLRIEVTPQGHSITLEDPTTRNASDRHALLLENQKANDLESVLKRAPAVVFSIDDDGKLRWGNARFDQLPVEEQSFFIEAARDNRDEEPTRISFDDAMSNQTQYYDLSRLQNDDHAVIYANDVTRLVEADNVRGAFVQTLTKTFADLSTGLAVFDRNQRLVLFNPAILDLTSLSAEFLTARPHMMEFFDRLRDNHMMPEPKSYASWRGQITEMIKSAANGHYSESWSLPGGLTYRLTGRPHPNGAIAFLIEDITDEMTLTRQSRSQLETHQAILDAMPDAIAVIGPDGRLLICNSVFSEVVGFDPDTNFARTSLQDVMEACKERFPVASIWDELASGAQVRPLDRRIPDKSGTHANVRVEPLPEGLWMLMLSAPKLAVPLSA